MNIWSNEADDALRAVVKRRGLMLWPPVGPRLLDGREPSPSMMRQRMKKLGIYDTWRRNR